MKILHITNGDGVASALESLWFGCVAVPWCDILPEVQGRLVKGERA